MRREVGLALVAVGAVLLAALVFWATAPSVDTPVDPDRVEGSDIGAAPPRPAPVARSESPASDEGSDGEREAGDAPIDPIRANDPDQAVLGGEKGALKRLRRTLADLERVPDEVELDPEMPMEEQDRLLAAPIQEKARILGRIQAQATALQNSEDPAKAARALLILADGHDHMAGWLRDRPAPTYLTEEGAAQFGDALSQRSEDQSKMADDVRGQARRQAENLPEDHPLREKLGI